MSEVICPDNVLIEIEADHISLILVIVIQIADELLFTASVILLSPPHFHFYHILLSAIIHDYICSAQIPRSGLHIIVARAIDDRS